MSQPRSGSPAAWAQAAVPEASSAFRAPRARPTARLKSERVQGRAGGAAKLPRPAALLKAERVQEALRSLAGWQQVGEAQALVWDAPFPDRRLAFAFLAGAESLAGEAARCLDLSLDAERLRVVIRDREARGVTKPGLELARRLAGLAAALSLAATSAGTSGK